MIGTRNETPSLYDRLYNEIDKNNIRKTRIIAKVISKLNFEIDEDFFEYVLNNSQNLIVPLLNGGFTVSADKIMGLGENKFEVFKTCARYLHHREVDVLFKNMVGESFYKKELEELLILYPKYDVNQLIDICLPEYKDILIQHRDLVEKFVSRQGNIIDTVKGVKQEFFNEISSSRNIKNISLMLVFYNDILDKELKYEILEQVLSNDYFPKAVEILLRIGGVKITANTIMRYYFENSFKITVKGIDYISFENKFNLFKLCIKYLEWDQVEELFERLIEWMSGSITILNGSRELKELLSYYPEYDLKKLIDIAKKEKNKKALKILKKHKKFMKKI
jgi:hypothetical protein